MKFSHHVGKIPRAFDLAHSNLFSHSDQHGEFSTIDCAVFRTHCDPV